MGTTTWVTSSVPLGSGTYVGSLEPEVLTFLSVYTSALSPPCTAVDAQQHLQDHRMTVNWATWKDGWVCVVRVMKMGE